MGQDHASLRREIDRLEAKLAEAENERDTLARLNSIAPTIAAEHDTQKLVRDITTHATELIFQTLNTRDVLEAKGTGLAMVKKHVDASGGRAWIEERANGSGAMVRFAWPKRPPATH